MAPDGTHSLVGRAASARASPTTSTATSSRRTPPTLGMWTFLVTEILFFGGLFAAYGLYRTIFPEAFRAGSHELDITLGCFNTVVLIASSLTMALAVRGGQTGRGKLAAGVARPHDDSRDGLPRREGLRVPRQVRRAPRPGRRASTSRGPTPTHVQMFFVIYFADDRACTRST